MSLVNYGTRAYAAALEQTLRITQTIADGIDEMAGLELMLGPQLTILFVSTH